MRIEVWSDVVCPWCYIGKRRLEAALARFANRAQVQIVFRAFELDPEAPKGATQSMVERLATKYGGGVANAQAMMDRVTAVAAEEGLQFHLEKTKPENTFDAHRLLAFAASQGKQLELTETLFHAYFTQGQRIGEHPVLAELATTVGLDRAAVEKVLADPAAYAQQVREDQIKARTLEIRGVPCAIVDGKYGVSGAQPVEAFVEVLEHVWKAAQN